MSFTGNNLTGTKWRFNTSISVSDSVSYIFDFYSYYAITGEKTLYGYLGANENPEIDYDGIIAYSYSSWVNDAYRDIEIIGGDDVETASLITFLESNAEFLGYADVTIEYGGNLISGMFESGAKAIRTLGKFCTSDFIVKYTAPSGGGGAGMVTILVVSNMGAIGIPTTWQLCNTATVTQDPNEPWKFTLVTPVNSMAFDVGIASPSDPGCTNVTYSRVSVANRQYIHIFRFGDQDGTISI